MVAKRDDGVLVNDIGESRIQNAGCSTILGSARGSRAGFGGLAEILRFRL